MTWLALRSLPSRVTPTLYAASTPEINRFYTADGTLLYEFGDERRTWVPLDQISPELVEAVIAVEDDGFRDHKGVSWYGMIRATVANLRAGRFAQGASTITQQVARGLFLTPRKTLWRKFSEVALARSLEEELTKNEILEIYLNQIYWGHGAYGAEEAARTYFCKHASELDRSEAVLLAGVISAPERFSPLKNQERARARFDHARRRLEEEDLPYPGAAPCRSHRMDLAPHTAVRVRTWLQGILTEEELQRGGYTVRLTLNARVQEAMSEGVERFLRDQGPEGVARPMFRVIQKAPQDRTDDCLLKSGRSIWVRVQGPEDEEGNFPVVFRTSEGSLPAAALELNLPGYQPPELRNGDWIQVTPAEELDLCSPWDGDPPIFVPVASPQLAAVALDASNGEVLGSVGGFGNRYHPFDRAFDARRSLGSTLKPFVYLAAAERWGWTAEDRLPGDLKQRFRGRAGRAWVPAEPHPLPEGEPLTMEAALVHSLNRPAVGVLARLGLDAFSYRWDAWGAPEIPMEDLSIALGTPALSPAQMAGLYAIFAGGAAVHPTLVRSVVDRDGASVDLQRAPPRRRGAPDPRAVKEVAGALHSVTIEGTGQKAIPDSLRSSGLGWGGKTGTSMDARDSWFVGWAGDIVVAVWIGNDDNSPVGGASGPRLAAPLWRSVMDEIVRSGAFQGRGRR